MINGEIFASEVASGTDELAVALTRAAPLIFLKKLSLNDWQWTEKENKHQGGPYIHKEQRDSGFFPPLSPKRRNEGLAEIREVYFPICWPALGSSFIQKARLVNYRSKGEETHLTGVPAEQFTGLAPASLILIAKSAPGSAGEYSAITIDSNSNAYQYIEDLFDLGPSFESGIFEPAKAIKTYQARMFNFIGLALSAFRTGDLNIFARQHYTIPKPKELALLARKEYQRIHGNSDFNPFSMLFPGDAVREISRGLEYAIFKEFEVRKRSMELVQLILGDDPSAVSVEQALINIITEFPRIDSILLSAAQTRKSRAGTSFELHIETLLVDANIPHQVQAVIDAKKRPDFILPSLEAYADKSRSRKGALVLSAKTTLRERWKQVTQEIKDCDLYLATVDENIAENAIDDMQRLGIFLVVPESLKNSDTTTYKEQKNVISFKDFFERVIREDRLPIWREAARDPVDLVAMNNISE